MIKQLAHLCIFTRDLSENARFYFDCLGLEKGFEFVKDGELFGYYIELGGNTFIEVFHGQPGEPGNINHLAIEVDDLDGLIERITSFGYECGEKKLGGDFSWQAWVTDPDGVRIEFQEYTAKSLQIQGGVCQVDW
jgi:catechol 2,3-dioxygenase-like lactoylglutathione lyase family enzyme